MTHKLTTLDFAPLFRQTIGMQKLFERIANQVDSSASQNSGYPPHNIFKTGEREFEVQVAVAGFAPGEVTVEVRDGHLVVCGEHATQQCDTVEVIHQGISARRFARSFVLGEGMEVVSASVENGILSVKLIDPLPDRLLPKTIDVVYKS